jgi:type I restriction-modification system DNA methylase subunit
MPRPRTSEVDAYLFIKEDLKNLGWDVKNPLRSKRGQVFTQGECLDEPRIQEQLGQLKPENTVKVTDTEYYVIEAKADKKKIEKAVKGAENKYAEKINRSEHIQARIISGVAGNDIENYVVKSKFLVDKQFKTIILNGKELTSLVSPGIAKYLIENNTNIIEELPLDQKLFTQTAEKINVILHNGAIPATDRGKVISALLLSLVDDTKLNLDASPTVLIGDINTRVNAVLQREGKPEFYGYIRISPPTAQANHKKFKNALVKTIQELKKLNIRSAMNSGADILGNFYEVFLKYGNWAKEIGIVLTPRHITHFAAQILDVNHKDIVYDLTCGTGGFLVSAFDYVKKRSSDAQIKTFKENNIFGVEQEPSVVALVIVNMIFRGDGKNNIKEANCFHEWLNLKRKGNINTAEYLEEDLNGRIPPVTKVLMNPPFALKERDEQEHKFVNQALAQMQKGGLLFAILPYSELIQDGTLSWRKEELLKDNTLICVVSFPEDLFYPVADKHTCGIIVRRGIPHDYTKDVLWVKITDDGFVKRKGKRVPKDIKTNDLTKSVEIIRHFIHDSNGEIKSIPRFIKASPITDQEEDLEIVPEVYIDNRDYSLENIKQYIQKQLRGILSFLVLNGYFPYEKMREFEKTTIDWKKQDKIKWMNLRVKDLFDVESGYVASSFILKEEKQDGYIPLFRPTSIIHNLIAGWINQTAEIKEKIFKAKSLMVSTDGEGSHTYSYVTPINFVPNSNTAVLKPKHDMPLSFLLFMAVAITNERWRYSYGRKPKGNRLKNLMLEVPIDKDKGLDVNAFEEMAKSIPEYSIVESYYKSLME